MGRKRIYPIDADTRTCRLCNKDLPVSKFNPDRVDGRGYMQIETRCNPCKRARRRAGLPPKEFNDRIAFVGTSDPRMVNQLFKYRLTISDFEQMVKDQNNACAICKEEFTGVPNIDHCHNSLQVRGLLCRACNTGLGMFRDDPDRLTAAINYLT